MYDHLKNVLTKIGFINPQNPEHWMLNIGDSSPAFLSGQGRSVSFAGYAGRSIGTRGSQAAPKIEARNPKFEIHPKRARVRVMKNDELARSRNLTPSRQGRKVN
jgi:hypothetical protein